MAADWESTTLGKIAAFVSGGTPSKDNPTYWGGVIPWVSAKDMKRFHLNDTEDHVTDEGVISGTKLVPEGTVFLLARGMTLLNDIPISIADRPMTFNQDVKAVQPKAGVSKDYLPYLLLGAKPRLLSLVDLAGHGTGRLNSDELKSLDVLIPPEPEQHAIAHILGTLDGKIELNRRMNETLEAIARALFKSWFVDFDPVRAKVEGRDPGLPKHIASLFPDSFDDSEQGEIPKGWNVGKVADVARLSREGVNPGEFPDEVFEHYSIPAFDEGRIAKIEPGEAIKSNKFVLAPGCVLLSKLNPRIVRVWLPDLRGSNRAISSTEFLITLPKFHISREFLFCLFSSTAFARAFATLVTGTSGSHQRVKRESLLEMDAVIPTAPVTQGFTRVVEPLLERVIRNITESRTLAVLRDALLPKLVSGELRVCAAKRLVEAQP
jgi:type I restriction enzyme S subunit